MRRPSLIHQLAFAGVFASVAFLWTPTGAAQSGTIDRVGNGPGPLAVSISSDGRHLVLGGVPTVLFGQGDWLGLVKGPFDLHREAAWYAPYLGRITRVEVINTIVPDDGTPVYPWVRGIDGRFDLTQFDPAFWSRLQDMIAANAASGRVLLLQMFDEVGLERGSNRWDHHPFNPSRNVNGLSLPGNGRDAVPEFYDVANSHLLALQDLYVRHLLLTVRNADNVILEIVNEYTGPTPWLQHWIDLVGTAEQTLGRNLLLTNMSCNASLQSFEVANAGIDLLDVWHAPTSLRNATLSEISQRFVGLRSANKPLITGRIGPEPDLTDPSPTNRFLARSTFWTIFLAGGAAATTKEDSSDNRILYGPPLYDVDADWERMILGVSQFSASMTDLVGLAPRADILVASPPGTTTFAAASRREVIAYSRGPGGGNLAFGGLADGDVTVRLYDPAGARWLSASRDVVVGGSLTIALPPYSEDIAVQVLVAPLSATLIAPMHVARQPVRLQFVFVDRNGTDRNGDGHTDLHGSLRFDSTHVLTIEALEPRAMITRTAFTETWTLPPLRLPAGVHVLELAVRTNGGERVGQSFRFVTLAQ
ncbi:MAG: hypothetical protein HYR85_07085 [Planctomycetes bacterium]|nr:hypothetical protein [Planctomycetota bacterium]